ncbi:MAG: hypothetical protein SGBAC_010288, partial [Bacillariaceae sp.]
SSSTLRAEFRQKKDDFEYLLQHATELILQYYDECGNPTETRLHGDFLTPSELKSRLQPISQQYAPGTNDDCLEDIKTTFRHSLKTMHPLFFDKLYFGSDPIGQVAELVLAVLNANTHVYHVSPVVSVMEVECIKVIGKQFGLQVKNIDGTLNPGGSMSNTMALLLARHAHFPHVKKDGWQADDKPIAFSGSQSHYSLRSAAMICGMGTKQMVAIPSNPDSFQMDPAALEESIIWHKQNDHKPFFVNAVAGTTVMGAFDDIATLREICDRYGLWLHVDACWGGFLAFASPEYKGNLLRGIELADSISFNPHKGLGVVQQCSMLITNNKPDALRQCNGLDAEYLFQPQNGGYDNGNKTLGCGRKGDALKLWLAIRKHGLDGFSQIANHEIEKAQYMAQLVTEAEDFELVSVPMGTNVCYWYLPTYFQQNPEEYTHERKAMVHKMIFDRMKKYGHCLVQQQPLQEFGLPNFFRLALGGDKTRKSDMDYVLNETRRLGWDMTPAHVDAAIHLIL